MKHTLLSTAVLAAFVLLGETATRASDTPRRSTATSAGASTTRAQAGQNPYSAAAAAWNQLAGVTAYGWNVGPPYGQGRALIINSSPLGRTNMAEIEEDLSIMARILDKALDEDARSARLTRYGFVAPSAKDQLQSFYLESYGMVFFLGTQVPLVPPPAREAAKPKPAASPTWEATRQELYGGKAPAGAAAYWGAAAPAEYDEKLVEQLKAKLLQALKEATHLRRVKPEEFITVVVFGPSAAITDPAASATGEDQPAVGHGEPQPAQGQSVNSAGEPTAASTGGGGFFIPRVDVTGAGGGMGGYGGGMGGVASTGESWSYPTAQLQSGRIGTTLTIRVKKADVDAFAAEKLSAQEFQAKAALNAYVGNTSGEAVIRSAGSRF
jgi:hypothetical protein